MATQSSDSQPAAGGDIVTHTLADDGTFPNNEKLPLVIYRGAVALHPSEPAASLEERFHDQRWGGVWTDGIFPYHHYHSTAHEVLGIAAGTARVQFGGDEGVTVEVHAGDVVVIPAGVAHKNTGQSEDFLVVGAYPGEQQWDMNRGTDGERPQTDENIARVPLPDTDPVLGDDGPLLELWRGR